jgi:asparagine synthase (glutamine-hydrolysing)
LGGIAGVFSLDGRAVEAPEVERMIAASGRQRLNGDRTFLQSSFGLGYRPDRATPESLSEIQPLVSSLGVAVCFDGRLDNRDELVRLCRPPVREASQVASDAALIVAAYERFGDRFAAELNGDFALALFDAGRQQLLLARDVMAARCLYYCPLSGVLLFASEIKCLLADPRVTASPDEDGLAELVLDYWCDDSRTCFKGIYSVPPGHLLLATRDGIVVREHWAFDPAREVRFRSFAEYRDSFRMLFEQSVRRRLRSAHPVAVTVSGGVDSSAIFCQAATLIRRESLPVAVHGIAMTFPPGTAADEAAFLDEIERAYDAPIARLPVSGYRFLDNADAVVRGLETPGVVSHTEAGIFEQARRSGCRVLLSGFFGDQMLFERGYLVDLARRGRWLKIRHDVREFSAWMTDTEPGAFRREFRARMVRALPPRWLFRLVKRRVGRRRAKTRYPPWFTPAFRERALVRASTRFETSRRFATAHAEQYYRHATAGHYVNSVRCEHAAGQMHGVDVSYPFRDRDLVAFLMAIPGDIVNWQGVPKGLLRHALQGVLPDPIRNRRWKADFTATEHQSMRQGHTDLASLVPRDCLAVRMGLVDGRILEESIGALSAIDGNEGMLPGWHLTDVVGLELWLRNFFGAELSAG